LGAEIIEIFEKFNNAAVNTKVRNGIYLYYISDDISNKSTQTEVKYLPGAFLCTISDGEDCRFSIYDDASPVESRFRKTPEYRTLFREIFDVLKRAAEAKDEGEKLPLLDDTLVGDEQVRVVVCGRKLFLSFK
jgi:hypothetical protein